MSLQTDNHASTPPLKVFLQAGCPSCRPTNSVKALKANSERVSAKVHNNYKLQRWSPWVRGNDAAICEMTLDTCCIFKALLFELFIAKTLTCSTYDHGCFFYLDFMAQYFVRYRSFIRIKYFFKHAYSESAL